MDELKVIHDQQGQTLTVWFDDPSQEYVCEETGEEVVLIKNQQGRVIGFEKLNFTTAVGENRLSVALESMPHS